jgi:hypothetical protein
MLGATRHVSLPAWVVVCACAVTQAERSIAATRAVPLADRSIVLSVCLELDCSFFLGFSDRVVKISICGSSLFNRQWTGYCALALTYVFILKR